MRIQGEKNLASDITKDCEGDREGQSWDVLWLPGTLNNRVNVCGEGRESGHVGKLEGAGTQKLKERVQKE